MTEECSQEVHSLMNLDYNATLTCVKNSFTDSTNFTTSPDNNYLKEDMIARLTQGVWFIPEVSINGVVYKGELDPIYVFEAICNSF